MCKVGLHDFEDVSNQPNWNGNLQKCTRCPSERIQIKAIFEKDLFEMYERGEISEAAYIQSCRQGFVDKKTMGLKNEDYLDEFLYGGSMTEFGNDRDNEL